MSSLSHGVTILYITLIVTSLLCFEPANGQTRAHLTINSFEEGGDGGGPSECDGKYHSNDKTIVALSTPWYAGGSRCLKHIMINGNGHTVRAKVVDECDTSGGCRPDIVDASRAVWLHLGVAEGSDQWGWMDVTWWDAGD